MCDHLLPTHGQAFSASSVCCGTPLCNKQVAPSAGRTLGTRRHQHHSRPAAGEHGTCGTRTTAANTTRRHSRPNVTHGVLHTATTALPPTPSSTTADQLEHALHTAPLSPPSPLSPKGRQRSTSSSPDRLRTRRHYHKWFSGPGQADCPLSERRP